MSGIAGIFHRDGRPVDLQQLVRMASAMAHRGPDADGSWNDGAIGLAHRMFRTTPESMQEQQPFADGAFVLVLDGRVDNREELVAAIESRGARLHAGTDAEIVLRAYELWDIESPARILGDFAFAVWDARKRRVFCARDVVGLRPFYYFLDGRLFAFASEMGPLLALPGVRSEPNLAMVGEYLASSIGDKEETLFRGIQRLPPAHSLVVDDAGFHVRRYWDIDPERELRYSSDQEFAGHFLELLNEAVRCRLRSRGPVGAELSGGLDSSSVVCVASAMMPDEFPELSFQTYSWIFPGSPADESRYIADVAQLCGVKNHKTGLADWDTSCFARHCRTFSDFPGYPNGSTADPLKPLANSHGVRVLLTGQGGDEWLTGSAHAYLDLLRQLRLVKLIREKRNDPGAPRWTELLSLYLRRTLWSRAPRQAKRAVRRMLGRNGVPSWIAPDFARQINLEERLRRPEEGPRFSSAAREDVYSAISSGWNLHCWEVEERAAALAGIELRHPFEDRRVIEFGMALPEEQRRRQTETKFVLRQALRFLLPESVRQRQDKAEFSHLFVHAFDSLGGERLFDSLAIASLGWLNPAEVKRLYRQMSDYCATGAQVNVPQIWPLWMIAGMDIWWKTVVQHPAASEA